MRSESPGWPPRDEFNREGVRDRARAEEKPAGTRRVACLGDSVTLGYGLPPEGSYPRRLQAALDERGPGVEVMTFALMGWATRQERIAYERIVRRYSPDLVLLGVCLNDLQDLQNNLVRPPAWLTRLHRRSALVRRVVDAEGRQIRSVRDLVADPGSGRVRQGYERLFEEVRRLRKEVEGDGARLALVVFPFADQVGDPPMADTPQRTIEAFCAREKITCVDPLPRLRPLGSAAFLPGDHLHLSGEGSTEASRSIVAADVIPAEWASSAALLEALGRPSPLVLEPGDVPRLSRSPGLEGRGGETPGGVGPRPSGRRGAAFVATARHTSRGPGRSRPHGGRSNPRPAPFDGGPGGPHRGPGGSSPGRTLGRGGSAGRDRPGAGAGGSAPSRAGERGPVHPRVRRLGPRRHGRAGRRDRTGGGSTARGRRSRGALHRRHRDRASRQRRRRPSSPPSTSRCATRPGPVAGVPSAPSAFSAHLRPPRSRAFPPP